MTSAPFFDIESIRSDFPILSRSVNGNKLVYLDNAATSQKPNLVIDAITDYYQKSNSNVHRGVHTLSMEATDLYESARAKVAQFINAKSTEEVIFVRNTTEAINLVAESWGRNNLGPDDSILLSEFEHHSNLVPWQKVSAECGASLRFARMNDDYALDVADFDQLLEGSPKLVAITQMSNVLGTILPIEDIIAKAHSIGSLVLIDAAQSVPHMPVDVQKLNCDFLAFSGHKMCGPTGIGVLYVRGDVMETMEPFMRGGEMVLDVSFEDASWNGLPMKFEAGTPNIADAIGLGAAIDYLTTLGMENVRNHEIDLTRYALEKLRPLEEITLYGTEEMSERGGVISFQMAGVHPHDVGTVLDQHGIAIRTGHHCAIPLIRQRMKIPSTARASLYLYNTHAEIDKLVDGLNETLRYFGDESRRTR